MEWTKFEHAWTRSDEFRGADPVERATWLCLLIHCADQENGGTIRDCADWGDRRWMQTVGVTKDEVMGSCGLWKWDGRDLLVTFYDPSREDVVRSRREAAIAAAHARWNPTPDAEGDAGGTAAPDASRMRQASRNASGMRHASSDDAERNAEESRGEQNRAEESIREDAREPEAQPEAESEDLFPKHDATGRALAEAQVTHDASEPERKPVSEEDQWRMEVQFSEMARKIRPLAKIGPRNWVAWTSLVDRIGLDAVLKAAEKTKATERWPDKVEETAKRLNLGDPADDGVVRVDL